VEKDHRQSIRALQSRIGTQPPRKRREETKSAVSANPIPGTVLERQVLYGLQNGYFKVHEYCG